MLVGVKPIERYARQIGSFPQVGLKIVFKKWNHQLGIGLKRSLFGNTPFAPLTLVASPLVSSHHQQTAASGRAMEHCPTAQHSNSGDRTTFQNRNSSNERQDFKAKKTYTSSCFFGSRNIDATFARTVIFAIDEEYIHPHIHPPLKLCCSSQGLHVHVLIIHDLKLLICQYIPKGKTWNLSTNSHHWHWKIHSRKLTWQWKNNTFEELKMYIFIYPNSYQNHDFSLPS